MIRARALKLHTHDTSWESECEARGTCVLHRECSIFHTCVTLTQALARPPTEFQFGTPINHMAIGHGSCSSNKPNPCNTSPGPNSGTCSLIRILLKKARIAHAQEVGLDSTPTSGVRQELNTTGLCIPCGGIKSTGVLVEFRHYTTEVA